MGNDKELYHVHGWIPAIPVSTEVEATSHEEAEEVGYEKLFAEHGDVDIDEVVKD